MVKVVWQTAVALIALSLAQNARAQSPQDPPPVAPAPVPVPQPQSTVTAVAPEQAAPPAEEAPWYKAITLGAFVDTYASINYNLPKKQEDANLYHPYDSHPGFGLAWAGVDLAVDGGPVGAVVQLRMGPAVKNLALNDYSAPGNIGNLQNAYVTWKPQGKDGNITLMAGKFDTLYGAE
jgi:Putative beta-barrel porin-2, OmpL-like. bbp2